MHCGGSFKPKKPDRKKYCSRECAFAFRRDMKLANSWPRSNIVIASCIKCDRTFASRDARRRQCLSCKGAPQSQVVVRACNHCGVEYRQDTYDGRPQEYCGEECRSIVSRIRRRIAKAQRKAKVRGVTVEAVDPLAVLRRDSWRCQLCGCSTPESLRGKLVPNAPEVDHIIPLALGGEHSYRNTQCACRSCNIAKGAKPIGQLRLVG